MIKKIILSLISCVLLMPVTGLASQKKVCVDTTRIGCNIYICDKKYSSNDNRIKHCPHILGGSLRIAVFPSSKTKLYVYVSAFYKFKVSHIYATDFPVSSEYTTVTIDKAKCFFAKGSAQASVKKGKETYTVSCGAE